MIKILDDDSDFIYMLIKRQEIIVSYIFPIIRKLIWESERCTQRRTFEFNEEVKE